MDKEGEARTHTAVGSGAASHGNFNIVAGAGSTVNISDSRAAHDDARKKDTSTESRDFLSRFKSVVKDIRFVATTLLILAGTIIKLAFPTDNVEDERPIDRASEAAAKPETPNIAANENVPREVVEAAQSVAKISKKNADRAKCYDTQREQYALSENTLEVARVDLDAGRYDSALKNFRAAAKYYDKCSRGVDTTATSSARSHPETTPDPPSLDSAPRPSASVGQ